MRLEDSIVVTRENEGEHPEKLVKILENSQEYVYRASKKTSEFFLRETIWLGYETIWLGHEIIEILKKLNQELIKVLLQLKPSTSKKPKYFYGAFQNFANV